MIDFVRIETPRAKAFFDRFGIEPLVFSGEALLRSGGITLLDARQATNKTLPSLLGTHSPDLVFGLEWTRGKDHMDYPGGALRIQTARAIRDASTICVITPRALERRAHEVARFNAKVLRQAKVPVVFASLAEREEELATPRDLSALGALLGFSDEELSEARALLETLPGLRYSHAFAASEPR